MVRFACKLAFIVACTVGAQAAQAAYAPSADAPAAPRTQVQQVPTALGAVGPGLTAQGATGASARSDASGLADGGFEPKSWELLLAGAFLIASVLQRRTVR